MPRRKQQAPKRAAVYMPDDESGFQESNTEGEGQQSTQAGEEHPEEPNPKEPNDKETDDKNSYSRQNSPNSVLSNQEAESHREEAELESRLSDVSDIPSNKSDASVQSQNNNESESTKLEDRTNGGLEKRSSTYVNFLSDSYWARIGLGLKVGKNGSKGSCDSTNEGGGKREFDWHQDALSKHFRPGHAAKPASKTNLFSGVHLQRQSGRACGSSVFTGASRFRCRDCSSAYDTLVELTVHMNRSGHYQDGAQSNSSTSKGQKKVSEGKEDAQKVLKCMFCGNSFDALQDLSVHMIKTKHYQKVPLKEPFPVLPPKLVPHAKKRTHEATRPCSPDSTTELAARINPLISFASHSSHAGYGYQNGASYAFQFETCKSQILKCIECGSSHDTLQQLTAHMMVTGHFLKVTSSASKKGKLLALDPASVEKIQSLTPSPGKETQHASEADNALAKISTGDAQKDVHEEKTEENTKSSSAEGKGYETLNIEGERPGDTAFKAQYLCEEDLVQVSTGGGDILKSLANTVTSAINKAQTGTPSWSAYPSIHAAYQFSRLSKNSNLPATQPVQLKLALNNKLRIIAPRGAPHRPSQGAKFFQAQRHGLDVKKENGGPRVGKGCPNSKVGRGEKDRADVKEVFPPVHGDCAEKGRNVIKKRLSPQLPDKNGKESPCSFTSDGSPLAGNSPEAMRTNPLSALQSVFNNHLGKANKPSNEVSEPENPASVQTTLSKLSKNLESPALPAIPSRPRRVPKEFTSESNDQPMDLTQSKRSKLSTSCPQSSAPLQRKHALSDIADMVKILPKATTPKPSLPSKLPMMKLETDMRCFEDASQKRKGRQSNWNPQHLLILQAQFASSLFLTTDGKYLLSELGPQERMHISKFTGLSMTTISHWLANVKYQLRKTGGTKFLKNMDSGHPILHCNDCATKFRTPAAFISHLESHLGFQIKDLDKLSIDHRSKAEPEFINSVIERPAETQNAEDEIDSKFKCKLCCRSFISNHAVKLHLSKTHSKSPETHSQFVEMDQE